MYLSDKITGKGEITKSGVFSMTPKGPFYLFLYPNAGTEVDSSIIQTGKLVGDTESGDCPLVVNTWNPLVFESVNITSEVLSSFRVFWGTEG